MPRDVSETLIVGIEYLSLPFQYPQRFFPLLGQAFTNRKLLHEMPRLTPHRAWFQSVGFNTVIDVGAFIGSFAYAMRHMLPEAQIYSFDPLPENITAMEKNMEGLGSFTAFKTALGDQRGEMDFYVSDFTPSSSALAMGDLHKQAFPYAAEAHRIKVPVSRLDDFIPRMKLKPPVLLKLDVQGFEQVVLEGASELLKRVDYLISEVSYQALYENQVLFDGLYDFLKMRGFRFAGNFDSLLSPENGVILQSDALFMHTGKE
ncbi:MAG TPA: FkbM family methyltransferase [Longilinea sp.]|nr:FkbM family methyltransferase [Longilinea sp.]